MSWYRTYRPTQLAGLHLTDVRAQLLRLLESKQFPHALLFAGPKGTGKTSAARIISAILNDPQNAAAVDQLFFAKAGETPQQVTLHEPDITADIVQRIQRGNSFSVQELDAASNRGIDDIRQLKERVFLPPQEGKVSVYILDEVHMLTTEAFNALLKLLEEPPAHVVFILATTELHKLPETVISRTTVIRFHTASEAELSAALTAILAAEKIEYELEAVSQVAKLAEGSFRDAVKMLEQVSAGKKKLAQKDIEEIFHLSSGKQMLNLVEVISQKNAEGVVNFFSQLRKEQVNEQYFYRSWLQFLHQQLLLSVTAPTDPKVLVPAKISHYLLLQFHYLPIDTAASIPFLSLELKSLEIVFKAKERDGGKENPPAKPSALPKKPVVPTSPSMQADVPNQKSVTSLEVLAENFDEIANVVPVAVVDYEFPTIQQVQAEEVVSQNDPKPATDLIAQWNQFLLQLRQRNLTLEALFRSSTPRVTPDGKAQVEVYYQFHKEQLQQAKFGVIIDECVKVLLGGYVQFEYVLAQKAKPGAEMSTVSGQVNEEDHLLQLAKDILV